MSGRPRVPLADRFWAKVDLGDPEACWPWLGALRHQGDYGLIRAPGRGNGNLLAHRVAYQLANGPIPAGMSVCHRCDNPPCVNPAHLFLGTQAENAEDMWGKGRGHAPPVHRGETHPQAKLTAAQVSEIRRSADTNAEAARRFGVSATAIHWIRRYRNWTVAA